MSNSKYTLKYTNKCLFNNINTWLINGPSYCIISDSMGTIIIVRRMSPKHPLEELRMDYDDWHNDTLMNEYKQFINNYTQVDHPLIVNI